MGKFGAGEYIVFALIISYVLLKTLNVTYFIGTLAVAFAIGCYFEWRRLSYFRRQGIPGPTPIPIYGNSQLFFQNDKLQLDMEWPKKYGSIFGMFGIGFVGRPLFISDPDILRKILIKDFINFSDRAALDDMEAFSADHKLMSKFLSIATGQRWKDRRRTITPAFTTGRIKLVSHNVPKPVALLEMSYYWRPVILLEHLRVCNNFTLDVIAQAALAQDIDVQRQEVSNFRTYCQEIMEMSLKDPILLFQVFFPKTYMFVETTLGVPLMFSKGEQFFRQALGAIIDERRNESKKDGAELSYAAIMKMHYIDAAIHETLRLYPIVPRLLRVCHEDTEYNGVTIHENDGVIIPIWHLHHNENYYPDPFKFEPERFLPENRGSIDPMTYMPFGAGPRNCIGMRFAQMEIRMTMAFLMHNYNFDLLPDTPKPSELNFESMNLLKIKNKRIELKVTPRKVVSAHVE